MMAFIRKKIIKGKTYYYIVESIREKNRIKQKVIKYIGTVETLLEKLRIADEILKNKKD